MAFVRFKKAKSTGCLYAYLVNNKRVKGKVKQEILCYLGRLRKVDKVAILRLKQKNPDLRIDWAGLLADAQRNLQKKLKKNSNKINALMADIDTFMKNLKMIREAKNLSRGELLDLLAERHGDDSCRGHINNLLRDTENSKEIKKGVWSYDQALGFLEDVRSILSKV